MTRSPASDLTAPTIAPVTRDELLSAVRTSTDELAQLEARRLTQVIALCDAFADDPAVPAGDFDPTPHVLHGEQLVFPGAAGTPGVTEFFHLELALALGCSPESAQVWIADTLNLRHRHPVLWGHAVAGRIPVWVAREVTRCCLALDFTQARGFDADHATAMTAWSPGRCQRVAREQAALLRSDAAEADRRTALDNRRVTFTPSRTPGLMLMEADLDSGDAAHLDRSLDRVAEVLRLGGAHEPKAELRSAALGHLAHPDRARHLLSDSLLDGGSVTSEGDVVTTEGVVITRDHERCRHGAQLILHLRAGDHDDRGALGWSVPDGQPSSDEHGRRELGVLTRQHLEELLSRCPGRVVVRPVIDLAEPMVLNQYRPNAELSWRIRTRDQRVMFPNSNRSAWSRGIDLDHTVAWPEGHTEQGNLGPLTRTIHRAKTHGGFEVAQESNGTFHWTTPTGQEAWVNAHGTWRTPPPTFLTDDPAETTRHIRKLLNLAGPRQGHPAPTGPSADTPSTQSAPPSGGPPASPEAEPAGP